MSRQGSWVFICNSQQWPNTLNNMRQMAKSAFHFHSAFSFHSNQTLDHLITLSCKTSTRGFVLPRRVPDGWDTLEQSKLCHKKLIIEYIKLSNNYPWLVSGPEWCVLFVVGNSVHSQITDWWYSPETDKILRKTGQKKYKSKI